jgi:hypothetical protein
MTKQLYEHNMEELTNTIETCARTRLLLPGLILLYSGIDIMAWLNRDESYAGDKRSDFIQWVKSYLFPGSALCCTAEDLYSARCSVLPYTSESTTGLEGEPKEIFYAWGESRDEPFQRYMAISRAKDKTIVLHVYTLVDAFKSGVRRFNSRLSNDISLSRLVYKRSNGFFTNIPKNLILTDTFC